MAGKGGGTRGRDRDRERECFSATRLFLLKIIPCSPVGTHTQTPPQLSVLSPSLSMNETSLFVVSWQAERACRGAKVCKEVAVLEEGESVDGGGKRSFETVVEAWGREIYSSLSSPCVMT